MIGTLWLEFIDGTNCTHQVVSWGTDEYFFSVHHRSAATHGYSDERSQAISIHTNGRG